MAPEFFVGIDGGASKTAGVLLDGGGRLLASHRTGGCAVVARPKPESVAVLAAVVDALCNQAAARRDDICRCGIGLNGVDFADEIPMQHEVIAGGIAVPAEKLTLVNDGVAALWGATPAPAAVVIQLGSAFTAAWRARYGQETPFDHLGVGKYFDIRREMVALVARMIDGRADQTPLKDRLLAHLNVTADKYAEAVFRGTVPGGLWATAPLVFEACEQGDAGAELLIERAVQDYARTAAAMVARTGREDPDVAFGGGVLQHAGPKFWKRLAKRIAERHPRAKVLPSQLPPEYGAGIMAAFGAGRDPAAFFEKVLAAHRQRRPRD